jgi:hypothetical protein
MPRIKLKEQWWKRGLIGNAPDNIEDNVWIQCILRPPPHQILLADPKKMCKS